MLWRFVSVLSDAFSMLADLIRTFQSRILGSDHVGSLLFDPTNDARGDCHDALWLEGDFAV